MKTINGYSFNGKIYGSKNNYYIFSSNEKVSISNEDANQYFELISKSKEDEYKKEYPNREECWCDGSSWNGSKIRVSIYYKENKIEYVNIRGNDIKPSMYPSYEKFIENLNQLIEVHKLRLDSNIVNNLVYHI